MTGPGPEVEGTLAGDLMQHPVLPQEKYSKSAEEKHKASDLYCALLWSLVSAQHSSAWCLFYSS